MLKGSKIVVGVTGSIAAFKIPYLIRLLKKEGAEVRVMMTHAAVDFVTPLTLSTLSENPVVIEPFDPEDGTWNSHVELGQWADVYLLAPVSANTMARMASGIADNFFLAAYLSAKCPVVFAPAMDLDMFRHPATQRNVATLISFGNILIEPAVGELASGLMGAGRMEEPENIVIKLKEVLSSSRDLEGLTALVTAGPTYEPVDAVRFIGNRSSGKMGFAVADELAGRGARVTLVSGPSTAALKKQGVRQVKVETAAEMENACMELFPHSDIMVMSAAVSDFRPAAPAEGKVSKAEGPGKIELVPTTDILMKMGGLKKPGQVLAGFALETSDEEAHARQKLEKKNLDLIVLNSLKDKGAGFGGDTNKVTIFDRQGGRFEYDLKTKVQVAKDIVDKIVDILKG